MLNQTYNKSAPPEEGTDLPMKKVRLRKNWRYESLLGKTFESLGKYLDQCCFLKATAHEDCPAQLQCREWWDNHCKANYSDLTPDEMKKIIKEFEGIREEWPGELLPPPSHRQMLRSRCDRAPSPTLH